MDAKTAMDGRAVDEPERRLMAAVLGEGLRTYEKYRDVETRRGRRLFAEADAWFASPDVSWLYAFERICLHLDIDPDYVRRKLRTRSAVSSRGEGPGAVAPEEHFRQAS